MGTRVVESWMQIESSGSILYLTSLSPSTPSSGSLTALEQQELILHKVTLPPTLKGKYFSFIKTLTTVLVYFNSFRLYGFPCGWISFLDSLYSHLLINNGDSRIKVELIRE